MPKKDDVQAMLAKIKLSEKGWQKSLATPQGSYSKNLAEDNLRRLHKLRNTLLSQQAADLISRSSVL